MEGTWKFGSLLSNVWAYFGIPKHGSNRCSKTADLNKTQKFGSLEFIRNCWCWVAYSKKKSSTVESRPFSFRILVILPFGKFAQKNSFAIDWLATCFTSRNEGESSATTQDEVWQFGCFWMCRNCWRRMGKTNGRRGPTKEFHYYTLYISYMHHI